MGRGLLLLASGLIIVVAIIQKSMSDRLNLIPERTYDYHQEMHAQNVSNSVMEYGIREIEKDQSWDEGLSEEDFVESEVTLQVFDYDDYTDGNPDIPSDHSIDDWNQYTILLVSNAQTNNAEAYTEVAITKDSFSKYVYFTDNEPSHIYFYDGDVLDGPVHTNDRFNIIGSPVFKGPVTSPNTPNGGDPVYEDITDFASPTIDMPGSQELNNLRNNGIDGGITYSNDIYVEFKQNGTVDIYESNGWSWSPPVTYNLQDYNGVISSSKKIYTKGTIKGQVTLHSAEEVEIMGDLKYSQDPKKNPESTDLLGIISEGNVIVDKDAHKNSGSKDLEINASIMALDESFEVENYNSGSDRGTLKLTGGLQQQERGAVGQIKWGGISGFHKDYSYDDRLLSMSPPYYPRASTFSKKYWKEKPVVLNK
ncbi:DUF4900 domain-containing protein [Aliifodinibius salicampi]|uniref:DUF4900 domain-containing protein n=1 Tax=Fodinibius salicampi TaxID=1920655 RepID=A0ABT3PXX4_9BACT|nr:DUF4900 domain-containing protein [Fodinibius salicampi]MCW9712636.1 DUF4900 domain-containing protein [Fodinibius salicampi]